MVVVLVGETDKEEDDDEDEVAREACGFLFIIATLSSHEEFPSPNTWLPICGWEKEKDGKKKR